MVENFINNRNLLALFKKNIVKNNNKFCKQFSLLTLNNDYFTLCEKLKKSVKILEKTENF